MQINSLGKLKDLIGNIDGSLWAKKFIDTAKENPNIVTDEDVMIGWFSNAIMSGYDEAHKRNGITNKPIEPLSFELILNQKQDLCRQIEKTEKELRHSLEIASKSGNMNTVSAITKSLQELSSAWHSVNIEVTELWTVISTENTAR